MKRKFNTIKKSRKKSKDIDEKIEYLNKECQKTGLNEIMNTSGIYSRVEQEPNPLHAAFRNSTYDGQGLAFSGTDFSINTTPIGGLHYSPPHPVTGERRRAFSWFGIASGFGPVGANSDRQLMWYFRSDLPNGGRWVSLERTRGENPYWGSWISTFFGAETLVPYNSADSNLPDDVKNKLDSLNINQYINPDDWKSPTNPVLFKNDLDEPSFIPIDLGGLSPQGYNYLKNKAQSELTSNYYTPEDKKNVINYYKKKIADPNYEAKPYERESLIRQMRAQGDGTKIVSTDITTGFPPSPPDKEPVDPPPVPPSEPPAPPEPNPYPDEKANPAGLDDRAKNLGYNDPYYPVNPDGHYIEMVSVAQDILSAEMEYEFYRALSQEESPDYNSAAINKAKQNLSKARGNLDNWERWKRENNYIWKGPIDHAAEDERRRAELEKQQTYETEMEKLEKAKEQAEADAEMYAAEAQKLIAVLGMELALTLFGGAIVGLAGKALGKVPAVARFFKLGKAAQKAQIDDVVNAARNAADEAGDELLDAVKNAIGGNKLPTAAADEFIDFINSDLMGRNITKAIDAGKKNIIIPFKGKKIPVSVEKLQQFRFKGPNYQQLFQSHKLEGNLLSEAAKLGFFEPEVLNVNIEKLRKGILPEFPKDPPPEMINGYSAKSKLAPKTIEGEPFLKVTKKDLAKNHLFTDKEINEYMDEINAINDYIRKNPAELIHAMQRYPKDDPRLAQLNWEMDQKMNASEEYMETHFPENQRLFNRLQAKIKQNIELTDPKKFEGHKEAPKFSDVIDVNEQKKKTIAKYFKKPIKKSKNKIQRHINMKEVKKKNIEEISVKKLEVKKIKSKNQILKSAYERQKSDWKEDLKEFTGWQAVAGAGPTNATSQTFGYVDSGFPVPNSETGQQVTTTASGLGGVEVQPSVVNLDLGFGETMPVNPPTYDQLALAGYAKPLLMKRRDTEDVNPRLDASQEFAQNVGADVMMNARVRGSGVSKEKADEIIKLAKFSKELETFFKYLFNKGPKVIDNNYFSKEQVTNLFKNGYINDKGNFAVNDYIIGSGQKLTYNPQNNTYSVKFNYDFSDNITEIINNPEKYNYKPGWNRLAMNLRLIFGGKYGLDALGLPGRAIEIAKAFGGGKAIPGEISIDADELHNTQWGQDLLNTHFEMNPEGDGFDTGHGYSAPPAWLDKWARKVEFTGDLRSLWDGKTRTWNLRGKIVDNYGRSIKKPKTPTDRTGHGYDTKGKLDSSGYGMDHNRDTETEARPIKSSKAVNRIKSMAKTKRQSLSLDKPIVRRKKES